MAFSVTAHKITERFLLLNWFDIIAKISVWFLNIEITLIIILSLHIKCLNI